MRKPYTEEELFSIIEMFTSAKFKRVENATGSNPADFPSTELLQTKTAPVLVVDDTEFNRVLMKRFLAEEKIPTVLVASGSDALKLVGEETFSLILTDIVMPDMTGYELIDHLVAQCRTLPPVIICSSADRPDRLPENVSDWLSKPFRLNDLRLILQKFGLSTHT